MVKTTLTTILLILCFASPAFGAEYWIATDGSNGNPGTEADSWATFAYSYTQISAGDVLWVKDGTYNEIMEPKSGTTTRAVNNYGAEIDGQGLLGGSPWNGGLIHISGKSDVHIIGMVAHDAGVAKSALFIGSQSSGCTIQKCVFYGHTSTPSKETKMVLIGVAEYNLLEDVIAFGVSRYTYQLAAGADHNTLRRCIGRFDDGYYTGEPIAVFTAYKGRYNIFENCVALDMHPDAHTPGKWVYAIQARSDVGPAAKENSHYGNIAFGGGANTIGFMVYSAYGTEEDNILYQDNVSYGNYRGFMAHSLTRTVIYNNNSAVSNYGDGFRNNADVINCQWRNNMSYGNTGYAFLNFNGDVTVADNLGYFNNDTNSVAGVACTDCTDADPDAVYLFRVEDASPYKGAGYDGKDIGANIVKRYVNGVLTDDDLWPWPEEAAADFWLSCTTCLAEVGRDVSDRPGLADSGKTFTNYLWSAMSGQDYPGDAPSGETNYVTLVATDDVATEAGPTTGTFTFYQTESDQTVWIPFSLSGTAGSEEYLPIGSGITLTGASGTTTITPVDDGDVEDAETVTLILSSGVSYLLGSPSGATITIIDDDVVTPEATVTATDSQASETLVNPGEITAYIDEGTGVSVLFTLSGTYGAGDFVNIPSQVLVANAGTPGVVTLTPIDDDDVEGQEYIVYTIAADAAYSIGTPSSATVYLTDNDSAPATFIDDKFRDAYQGPNWFWIEDGFSGVSLEEDGVFKIDASYGQVWQNLFNPAWLAWPVAGDFDIWTQVNIPSLTTEFQKAGVVFKLNGIDSHVHICLVYQDAGGLGTDLETVHTIDLTSDSVYQDYANLSVYFRMVRSGASIYSYYSVEEPCHDGDWMLYDPDSNLLTSVADGLVGPFASTSSGTTFRATFPFVSNWAERSAGQMAPSGLGSISSGGDGVIQ